MTDTIFALSSGAPPAAIGVIRISGPDAHAALRALVGREIAPRKASLAKLRATNGSVLDEALVLWFPGSDTATGEDLLELLLVQDKIANRAKDVAGIVIGRKLEIPESIVDEFLEFVDRCVDATKQARKSVRELDELFTAGFRGAEAKLVSAMIEELDRIAVCVQCADCVFVPCCLSWSHPVFCAWGQCALFDLAAHRIVKYALRV